MQNPTPALQVAQITQELVALETRREQIATETRLAQRALQSAKNAVIDGADFGTVVEAQSRLAAMEGTLLGADERLKQTRARLAEAEARAQRDNQEAALLARSLEFQEQREALENRARTLAEQFETGLNELVPLIRDASGAQMKVEGAAYEMKPAPRILERDGQHVEVAAIRAQPIGALMLLAANFGDAQTRRTIASAIAERFGRENDIRRSREQSQRQQRGEYQITREEEESEIVSPTAYADPTKVEVRSMSR